MNPKLQFLEVEPIVLCDNDFAVENASGGQLRIQRLDQLGKVSIQRFRIAALNKDFVPVAEDQRAKPVPLRFEDPHLALRQRVDSLREHRQHRRVHGKMHASNATTVAGANQSEASGYSIDPGFLYSPEFSRRESSKRSPGGASRWRPDQRSAHPRRIALPPHE